MLAAKERSPKRRSASRSFSPPCGYVQIDLRAQSKRHANRGEYLWPDLALPGSGHGLLEVPEFFRKVGAQAFFHSLFDLPDPLPANPVALADLAQRQRLIRQEALTKNDQLLVFQRFRKPLHLFLQYLAILFLGKRLLRSELIVRKKAEKRSLAILPDRPIH